MFLLESDYSCSFSKIAFKAIIKAINNDQEPALNNEKGEIIFVDGDSTHLHSTMRFLYEMKKEGKLVYIITLVSDRTTANSIVIRHLSDKVIYKSVPYAKLEHTVRNLVRSKPKTLSDNVFGDIFGDVLKSSQKENHIFKLLLEGYSHAQISEKMNISVKTVSGYKNKAVRRHGARNFNELYLSKMRNAN